MAYIAPNSTVWLYKGVPLDPNYENTYWFPDKATQKAQFDNSYLAYTFTAQSYCRATGNSIRIQRNPDDLINCNYMAFRNTSFGNKIFYAFIDEVAYINNSTAEVRFTIDVLQTYFRDVIFMPSYIEREHSATDGIGDNIVPEPAICSGEEVVNYEGLFSQGLEDTHLYTVIVTAHDLIDPKAEKFMFQVTDPGTNSGIKGATLAGQYNVAYVTSATLDNFYQTMTNYISKVGQNSILAMYTIPSYAYDWNTSTATSLWLQKNVSIDPTNKYYVQLVDFPTISDTLDGYRPVNKKLYTYPYNYLRVRSGSGDTKDFRYEFFAHRLSDGTPTTQAQFRVQTTGITPDQAVYCFPVHYRGSELANDWAYALEYNTFPATSFVSSQYSDYLAANSNKLLASQVSRIASAVTIAAQSKASPVGAMNSLLGTAMGGMTEYAALQDLKAQTNIYGGTSSGFFGALNRIDLFQYMKMSVNRVVAKRYDDYFTRYGYATNQIKFPNFILGKGRQTFNYIKTNGASIVSKDAPADAIQKMKQIFDSGTTVWLQLGNVGNFGLSNDPI